MADFVVGMCHVWIKPPASCMPNVHDPAAFVAVQLFQLQYTFTLGK